MTQTCVCPPEMHRLVEKGYFESDEDVLKRAMELLIRENKILRLKERMNKTASDVGNLKYRSLSELVEEMHEEEDEL